MYYITLLVLAVIAGTVGFIVAGNPVGAAAGGVVALFVNRLLWTALNPDLI